MAFHMNISSLDNGFICIHMLAYTLCTYIAYMHMPCCASLCSTFLHDCVYINNSDVKTTPSGVAPSHPKCTSMPTFLIDTINPHRVAGLHSWQHHVGDALILQECSLRLRHSSTHRMRCAALKHTALCHHTQCYIILYIAVEGA